MRERIENIPFAVTSPDEEGLTYLAVEISYAGQWVNINDGDRFRISAEATRDNTSKTWRKVTAQSPILGGDYLVHAVPEMMQEQVGVWVYGNTQSDLADNIFFLTDMFEQLDYRLRWTTNEYRETWTCQVADSSTGRGHVWTHNQMAVCTFTVPRYPRVFREHV